MAEGTIKGKIVLITGSSRGIGREIAIAASQKGAVVVCVARTMVDVEERGSLTETVNKINSVGGEALAIACDLTKSEDINNMIRKILDTFGRIDILVNNAGIYTSGLIESVNLDYWNKGISLNLTAPFLLSQYCIPSMTENGGGTILNITSASADRYDKKHVAYSTIKSAVNRFSMNLAKEVKENGIVVNALDPGLVKTEMNNFYEGGDDPSTVVPAALWLIGLTIKNDFSGNVVSKKDFETTWP